MNHSALASVLVCLGLLAGCATFETQTPDRILAEVAQTGAAAAVQLQRELSPFSP